MIEYCAVRYELQYLYNNTTWITCPCISGDSKASAIAQLCKIRLSSGEPDKYRLIEVKRIETVLPD